MRKLHALTGPAGLLVAVIQQAAVDYTGDDPKLRRDAARYFDSPIYAHHMTYLGLRPDLLPTVVNGGQDRRS
jgi:hypothetical protein